jgi:transposase-like protein
MGRRGYPPEFRRRVLELIEGGRKVAEFAHHLGISDQTIYTWRPQDRVDRVLEAGLTSAEKAELVAAQKRIRDLVTELAVHRRATELLKGETGPKGGSRSGFHAPGHSCTRPAVVAWTWFTDSGGQIGASACRRAGDRWRACVAGRGVPGLRPAGVSRPTPALLSAASRAPRPARPCRPSG